MKLDMYHGRTDPDQDMDDWGLQGPVIHGIEFMVCTYGTSTVRIGFKNIDALMKAQVETGWRDWDDLQLLVEFHGDLLKITTPSGEELFYGDYSLEEESCG